MPIFPRRQLQLMLDELGPWLTRAKATDLMKRTDNKDPDQSIPGEYELAVGWALSKLTEIEIGPIYGGRDPDFLATDLFPTGPAVVEVMALSDDPLSGQSSMERTANIINQFADRVRKKASAHLHYTFQEASGYRPVKLKSPIGPWTHQSQYFRTRLTSRKFNLTPEHEAQLRNWLSSWPPPRALEIKGDGTAVVVVWKERVHSSAKTFSSMPSEAHDLADNPLYKRLGDKDDQLAEVPASHLKCVILGDAGCRLLRTTIGSDPTRRSVMGKDIIWYFLRDSTSIDIVCVLSPRRANEHSTSYHNNPRLWHIDIFDKAERPPGFYRQLDQLKSLLPNPHLHGYQARQWVQQGLLNPQRRGQYLPLSYGGRTVRVSARALLEVLAGRMNEVEFKQWITGDQNPFETLLARGCSITAISIEPHPDEDDDYVVIKFAPDPNASPLRLPPQLLDDQPPESAD